VIDDVGCGAILKNTETDRKAIIVDVGVNGVPVVCTYHGDEDDNKEPSFEETDYKISKLSNLDEWIVLTLGDDDFLLVD
jgi:hypothetical protein